VRGPNSQVRRVAVVYICVYTRRMSKQYSIADARRNLPSLLDEAESGSEVQLTRRGKAVAVVLSVAAYERLTSQRTSFAETYRTFREKFPAGEAGVPRSHFRALRDRSRGRKVDV
jgi:prevent-host-death family protein